MLCLALAAALLAVITLRILRDAEAGVALIKQDIADVVTLETIKAAADHPLGDDASVQSVDFRGPQAMVRVVVTQIAPSHVPVVKRETRFYVQDRYGWHRAGPIESFWGAEEALDTPHLRFVFHALDRSAVQAIAAEADALYVDVHQALGLPLAVESPALTVTVVLDSLPPGYFDVEDGRIQIISPVLLAPDANISDAALLGWHLRCALINSAFTTATAQSQASPQWQAMAEGMYSWLARTDDLPLNTLAAGDLAWTHKEPDAHYLGLDSLLVDPAHGSRLLTYPRIDERAANTQRLIGFVAQEYGLEALGRLFQGLGKYADWDNLSPAVLGVSAQELEEAWCASWHTPG